MIINPTMLMSGSEGDNEDMSIDLSKYSKCGKPNLSQILDKEVLILPIFMATPMSNTKNGKQYPGNISFFDIYTSYRDDGRYYYTSYFSYTFRFSIESDDCTSLVDNTPYYCNNVQTIKFKFSTTLYNYIKTLSSKASVPDINFQNCIVYYN